MEYIECSSEGEKKKPKIITKRITRAWVDNEIYQPPIIKSIFKLKNGPTYFVKDPNLPICCCPWNTMSIVMEKHSLLLLFQKKFESFSDNSETIETHPKEFFWPF